MTRHDDWAPSGWDRWVGDRLLSVWPTSGGWMAHITRSGNFGEFPTMIEAMHACDEAITAELEAVANR